MIGSKARGRFDYASPPKRWEGEHDLTGPRALVCIAGELREREAARKARAARRRRSWRFRVVARVRDWLARRDRGRTEPPEPRRFEPPEDWEGHRLSTVYEALTHAQLVARRAGQTELADALHALFLLDLTGNLADVAPLVASVRASLQSALGDDPGAVN